MSEAQQFEHAMRALAAKFSGELPHKLKEVHRLYFAALQNTQDDATLNLLYRTLHGLAGAARTFGHPHISDAAQDLERCIAELIQATPPPSSTIGLLQLAMDKFLDSCMQQKAA
jgi:chemotaxis protein histidine kinase CheA